MKLTPSFRPGIGNPLHHYDAEVNEFLAQMNECATRRILVIGATNYLNHVDVAVRRPVASTRRSTWGLRTFSRIEAVKLYMRERPQEEIDLFSLLEDKQWYSFADLELVVNQAARDALQPRQPITYKHLEDAFRRIQPSINAKVVEEMLHGVIASASARGTR